MPETTDPRRVELLRRRSAALAVIEVLKAEIAGAELERDAIDAKLDELFIDAYNASGA